MYTRSEICLSQVHPTFLGSASPRSESVSNMNATFVIVLCIMQIRSDENPDEDLDEDPDALQFWPLYGFKVARYSFSEKWKFTI